MIEAQRDDVERALWSAVRALADQAALSERIAKHATSCGDERSRARHAKRTHDAREQAEVLRRLLH